MTGPARTRLVHAAAAVAALGFLIVPEHPGSPATFRPASLPSSPSAFAMMPGSAADALQPAAFATEPARPFLANYGDAASAARAETCLTEAIYYEGALESERGQRAIAQVVLNRVRHPAYPDTVCGVVFQGQHRTTGCQFTFTCDGARARPPVPNLWRRANLVAKAALGGAVAEEVGLSTHYHADYVAPYWSASLDPSGQIGRHLFYRWKGNAGQPAAFSARYTGREPEIGAYAPNSRVTVADSAMEMLPGSLPGADATSVPPPAAAAPAPTPAPFKARPLLLAGKADKSP